VVAVQQLAEILAEGKNDGSIRKDIDVHMGAHSLIFKSISAVHLTG
jgi:hypothetical protein